MIGKLNYYLGKRAYDEGRHSVRYKEVDFCQDPSAICRGYYEDNDELNAEVRWLMGMLYWINKVQTYNVDGWSYLGNLHAFVNGGMKDTDFLDSVSRIVTRGCHDRSSCGNAVSSAERRAKFNEINYFFEKGTSTPTPTYFPTQSATYGPTTSPTSKPTLPPTDMPTPMPTRLPTARPTTSSPTTMPTLPPVDIIETVKPKNSPKAPSPNQNQPPSSHPSTAHPTTSPNRPPSDRPTWRATKLSEETLSPVSSSPVTTSPDEAATTFSTTITEAFDQDEDSYQLTPDELAHRLNFANNYCASNTEEAKAKCATSLRTCNFEDPPCKQGLWCIGDVVCSIEWSDMDLKSPGIAYPPEEIESSAAKGGAFESYESSSATGRSPDDFESTSQEGSPSESGSVADELPCNGMCLRPLNANECMPHVNTLTLLPDCSNVAVGDMCESIMGECTDVVARISNCPGGRDIFMRVLVEKCGGASMVDSPSMNGSYGSIPPALQSPSVPSSQPSSLAQDIPGGTHMDHNNNFNPVDDSGGIDEDFFGKDFFGTAGQEDEPAPGGWWIWDETSGSTRLFTMPMLLLLCSSITVVLIAT